MVLKVYLYISTMQNMEHWSHGSCHMLPWLNRRENLQVLDLSGADASLQTHCLPLLCQIYNKRLDYFFPRVADNQLLRHIYLNTKTFSYWPETLQICLEERRDNSWKSLWTFTRGGWGWFLQGNQGPGWSLLAGPTQTSRVRSHQIRNMVGHLCPLHECQ